MLLYGTATPAKIGDLAIDVVIDHETKLESDVTDNPVEDGFTISDHVSRKPLTLTLTAVFTPTPVSYLGTLGNNPNRLKEVADELQDIWKKGEPITIVLADGIYTNMVMTSAPLPRNVQNGFCYKMQLSFRQVRIGIQKTEDVPEDTAGADAQGKAGATETDSGSAAINDIGEGFMAAPNAVTIDVSYVDLLRNGSITTGLEMTAAIATESIQLAMGGGNYAGNYAQLLQ